MSKRRQKALRQQKEKTPVAAESVTLKNATGSMSSGSMSNWLAVLILVTPFLYSEVPLDPAVAVRHIFLSAFLLLFIFFFLVLRKRFALISSVWIKVVFGLGAVFGVWNFLWMAGAINVKEGYFETRRHLMNLILLYIVLNVVMQESSALMKICVAVMLVSLVQSFIGILQVYDIAFTELPGNFKPYALMTNRNLFGSAQAFSLPFVFFVLYAGNKFWKTTALLSLAGITASILLSQTRSAWLSGTAVFVVSALLVLIFVPAIRKKWLVGSLAGTACAAGIVTLLFISGKENKVIQSVTERAASLTGNSVSASQSEANISERVKIWKKTMRMIKDHSLTGVGTGNWKINIPAYGLDSTVFAKGFYAPDRPHNVYLQTASETGIPGAVFYFGMWITIALTGFKLLRKTNNDYTKVAVILMLAGLSAVALDAMFSFATERIEHSLYMTLMAGIILGSYASLDEKANRKTQAARFIVWLPVASIISFNLLLGKKKYDFEKYWKFATVYNNQGRYTETIEMVKAGKNLFFSMDITGNPLELFSGVAYKQMKKTEEAIKEFRKAAAYHPYKSRIYSDWGTVYSDLQQYGQAIEFYKKALQLTPELETTLKNLAVNYFLAGHYAACIETIGKLKTEADQPLANLLNEAKRKQEDLQAR